MTGIEPDSGFRLAVLRQAWRTVAFVHWRYGKSVLQPLMPPGLEVEQRDGSAWVTLTPLQMRDVRPPRTRAVPGLRAFAETNLRTYVRGPGGRPGIWFFSLDAANAWITIGARLALGAPYYRAKLDIGAGQDLWYTGVRAGRAAAAYRLHVRPGRPIEPDGLDVWLTHRWRAYTRHAGLLLEIPVRHEPWPLQTATLTTVQESLTAAAGLPAPPAAALAHYSDGVTGVAFGPARPVRALGTGARSRLRP